MPKTLALIHTTPVTVQSMKDLAAQHLPGIRVVNILDDSLLQDVMANGGVTPEVQARIKAYVEQGIVAGADAVMCCCSSVGEAVERAAETAKVPVLRIDEPMAVEAANTGKRIGVIATVQTTLNPTVGLIRRKAAEMGKTVEVEPVLVEGAFAAVTAGRGDEHDRLVKAALEGLLERSDVVVLAQASIARVLAALPQPPRVPVLSSPLSGLKAAGAKLA